MIGVNDFAGSVAPVPVSRDWKNNHLIANANGYVQVGHFSDTFVIYVNYMLNRQGWLLANQINRENMGDITDYYNRVIQWYNSII